MKRLARRSGSLSRLKDSSGQILALYVIALVGLLGLAGLVVDVGHAFFVKRSLQAAADAAATAGASELPDPAAAAATAQAYSGSPGGLNERDNVSGVKTSVSTKCLSIAPCHPVNAVVVEQSTKVNTFFARVLGIDSFDVSARATACSPCSTKPLDVMLVLDRTGSMCQDSRGGSDPSCTDLNNAKEGMRTFLSFLDPEAQWVGLAVFPPGPSCAKPRTSNYHSPSMPYTLVPLSQDYKAGDDLNPSSSLVSAINCQQGGGRTAYANAIEHAQAAIDARGRPDAPDVVVILSDGAANIGPDYYDDDSPYRMQPCHQGVWSASAIKGRGTEIFSIGYDLNALGGGANVCKDSDGDRESPAISAFQALQQMSSGPDFFFNQPTAGELNTLFTGIASQLTGTRLVDDSLS